MKFIFKAILFLGSCMLLCSFPRGSYMKYNLVGGKETGSNNYNKIIINKLDTILVKVGIVDRRIYKTTTVIVKFEDMENNEFKVQSTKYGESSLEDEKPNLFRKTIK